MTPLILIVVENLRNENHGINKVHRVNSGQQFFPDVNAWYYIIIMVTMEGNYFDAFFVKAWCYKIIMVALKAKSSKAREAANLFYAENNLN